MPATRLGASWGDTVRHVSSWGFCVVVATLHPGTVSPPACWRGHVWEEAWGQGPGSEPALPSLPGGSDPGPALYSLSPEAPSPGPAAHTP